MSRYTHYFLLVLFLFAASLNACKESPNTTDSKPVAAGPNAKIEILAADFKAQSGDFEKLGEGENALINAPEDAGWLSYEIIVSEAGRYQVEIEAKASGDDLPELWVEDHIDNTDGRTYNITSTMPFKSATSEFQILSKDGSPLNAGKHQIKLHVGEGSAQIKSINFTLLRPHQLTPTIMEQVTDGDTWEVVWADEFEVNGLPDSTKWTYDLGNWGWGNNEPQYYTEGRLENSRIEDGNLIIEAIRNDQGHDWTSARLTTRGKVSFVYGKIEFRAKIPVERGNWAAGWTLGDDYRDERSWPYCGEIDILETVGFEINDSTGDGSAHASVHCGAYYFKLGNQPTAVLPVDNMEEAFHTYAVEWTPAGIDGFVDGKKYFSYTDTSNDLAWPFSKAQNIILNLAMGGGWGGAQGIDPAIQKQQFIIDYVRVYARK
ncbi:MAG: family 16 glycosylhydrolase [Bacteroidia bacterium]